MRQVRSGRRAFFSLSVAVLVAGALVLGACGGGERTSGEFRLNPGGAPGSTQQAAGF